MIANTIMPAAMGFFGTGLKNEFGTAVVNEPSVFEPRRLYCITELHFQRCFHYYTLIITSLDSPVVGVLTWITIA